MNSLLFIVKAGIMGRFGQGAFHRPPASINAHLYCSAFNARYLRPFAQGAGLVAHCQQSIPSGVSMLFSCGGPPTIRRSIVSAIVSPVNTVLRRGRISHIGKKVLKSFFSAPTSTDGYAAPAVVRIAFYCWVIATIQHVSVGPVLLCGLTLAVVTMFVSGMVFPGGVFVGATTTTRAARGQGGSGDGFDGATFASAKNKFAAVLVFVIGQRAENGPKRKGLTHDKYYRLTALTCQGG